MSRSFRILSLLGFGLFALNVSARAPEPARIDTDREASREFLFSMRDALASMHDDGAIKSAVTDEATAPTTEESAPEVNLERLAQYLRQRLRASEGHSFQDAYLILRDGIRRLRTVSSVPRAILTVLDAAERSAEQVSTYRAGWEIMYRGMAGVASDPYVFVAGGMQTFRALCQSFRQMTTEKSWQDGFVTGRMTLRYILRNPSVFVHPLHRATFDTAIRVADRMSTYEAGYKVMLGAVRSLANSYSHLKGHGLLQAALAGPQMGMSFQDGTVCAEAFLRTYLYKGNVDGWDRATIEFALRAADQSPTYQGAYRILRDALQSLM